MARWMLPALLGALVWLSCIWFGSWEWNANQATRMYAALSIVEQGDATIDEYAPLTIDKARFGAHFYSDKAPGMTLLALPAVAFADAATGQQANDLLLQMGDRSFERFLRWRLRLAVAIGPALLAALAAMAMFDWGRALGGSAGSGLFAALGMALGTPLWGWSTTLFGHAPVAALLLIASWGVWRGTESAEPSRGLAVVAGLALGWAVLIEYTAVFGDVVVGLWGLWRLGRERLLAAWPAVAATILVLTILPAYNVFAFGTPFRLGYQGVVGFEGMNQGLFGLTYPRAWIAWEVIGGLRRGLAWVAPILLPGLIGLLLILRHRATRATAIFALTMATLMILYNAAYFYWDGGNSTGPRHAVPAIPFLALGLAPLWKIRLARIPLLLALAGSIAINLVIASADIISGGQSAFPLWQDVFLRAFVGGQLRTLPSEWFGWSPWAGLATYLAILLPSIVVLARLAQKWKATPPLKAQGSSLVSPRTVAP